MKKTKIAIFTASAFLCTLINVHADTPSFDNSSAQSAAGGYLGNVSTFLLWAVPVVTGVVLLVHAVSWMCKDEDDKEQKPLIKTAKKTLFVALFAEFVSVIIKILGIG